MLYKNIFTLAREKEVWSIEEDTHNQHTSAQKTQTTRNKSPICLPSHQQRKLFPNSSANIALSDFLI